MKKKKTLNSHPTLLYNLDHPIIEILLHAASIDEADTACKYSLPLRWRVGIYRAGSVLSKSCFRKAKR